MILVRPKYLERMMKQRTSARRDYERNKCPAKKLEYQIFQDAIDLELRELMKFSYEPDNYTPGEPTHQLTCYIKYLVGQSARNWICYNITKEGRLLKKFNATRDATHKLINVLDADDCASESSSVSGSSSSSSLCSLGDVTDDSDCDEYEWLEEYVSDASFV